MTVTPLNQDDTIRALAVSQEITYSEAQDEISSGNYEVLTEEEAYARASDYIQDTLWAFNQGFVERHSDVAYAIPNHIWKEMASQMCEDFNDVVRAMIEAESDLETFINDAISTDGLGHFLNSYDGSYEDSDDLACNLDNTYIIIRVN